MTKFFHFDRKSLLSEGDIINLTKYTDISPDYLQKHIDKYYPSGFTGHGEYYLLQGTSASKLINPNIEIFFEYVRRAYYKNKPSRFQSFFAFNSMEEVVKFIDKFQYKSGKLWEVECEKSYSADMSLLNIGSSILTYSYNAHLYWEGKSSDDPIWEVLLAPPVNIIQEVKLNF